jgi:hypothetical protein
VLASGTPNCGSSWDTIGNYLGANFLAEFPSFGTVSAPISLSAYAGQEIQLAFVGTNGGNTSMSADIDVILDNVNVINVLANDLAIVDLLQPVTARQGAPGAPTGTQQIEVVIRNNAADPGSKNITLEYIINGGTPVSQAFTTSIDSAEFDTLVFTTTANMAAAATYNIDINLTYAPDLDLNNNSLSTAVTSFAFPPLTIKQTTTTFDAVGNDGVFDFETAGGSTVFTSDQILVDGLLHWDFENVSNHQVQFTPPGSASIISGSNSAYLHPTGFFFPQSIGYLI